MPIDLSTTRRILVVTKFRYLGDTIVATPLLRQLKQAAPQAEIELLAGPAIVPLLKHCPFVSHVRTFPAGRAAHLLGVFRLASSLRRPGYDAAFVVNRSLHAALVTAAAGIPHRIGFDTEGRRLLLTVAVPYDWGKPDRDCALDLLRAVGVEAAHALPELWVSDDERETARKLLAAAGVDPGATLVAMHPGAHDAGVREWGAERYAVVADRLVQNASAHVVLMGSADERGVAERVAASMEHRPVLLAGSTDLRQALAVISLCRLWVGNDSGMLHAAVALGTPTVGVFGPTKARRWGYDTPCHRTMVAYPPTPAEDAATIRRCLDAVTPEMVTDAAIPLLVGTRQPAPTA